MAAWKKLIGLAPRQLLPYVISEQPHGLAEPEGSLVNAADAHNSDALSIRYLGTAGFVISHRDRTIVLDPYLTRPGIIASLLADGRKTESQTHSSCFSPVPAPAEMLDALLRMLRPIDRPNEAFVLAPMIEREILFRALQGPFGDMLAEIASPDGRLSQVRRATQWIREHYTEPFRVEPHAAMADMSGVAVYRTFIAITALTPM